LQTQLITLTSDFGTNDGSIMLLKSSLSKQLSDIAFTDFSHQIKPFQIAQAGYLVSNLFHQFNEGTIHCVLVNVLDQKTYELKAAKYKEHYFIGVDNGIFSYLFNYENVEMVSFGKLHEAQFFYKHVSNSIASIIESKKNWDTIQKVNYRVLLEHPVHITDESITGCIWLIDDFGNLITNFHRNQIEHIIENKSISISYGYKSLLTKIEANLFDANEYEPVAYYNQFGYLEIAIRNHNISKLFNLNEGGIIKINYQ
ncbi:MAG: hypothetical protein RL065_2233, partial [Bacteroidota bacterium]|jgi:S-adenosylmethionine hydrolase